MIVVWCGARVWAKAKIQALPAQRLRPSYVYRLCLCALRCGARGGERVPVHEFSATWAADALHCVGQRGAGRYGYLSARIGLGSRAATGQWTGAASTVRTGLGHTGYRTGAEAGERNPYPREARPVERRVAPRPAAPRPPPRRPLRVGAGDGRARAEEQEAQTLLGHASEHESNILGLAAPGLTCQPRARPRRCRTRGREDSRQRRVAGARARDSARQSGAAGTSGACHRSVIALSHSSLCLVGPSRRNASSTSLTPAPCLALQIHPLLPPWLQWSQTEPQRAPASYAEQALCFHSQMHPTQCSARPQWCHSQLAPMALCSSAATM